MKQDETLELIKGEFTAEQAKEILTNIFSTKIHFHQMKNFSSVERLGKDDEIAMERLPELKRELKRAIAFSPQNFQIRKFKSIQKLKFPLLTTD